MWTDYTIGELINFSGGAQPPRSTFIFEPRDGYVRLLQIRDYKTDKYATYIPIKSARKFCDKNDVMIGRYGPPIFQILRGKEGAYNVALLKAESKTKNLTKDYMFHFLCQEDLLNFVESLSARSAGQTGIEMDQLKDYVFPLPPVNEQKQISKILNTFDENISKSLSLIKKKEKQLNEFQQLLLTGKVRFKKYIKSKGYYDGDLVKYPNDWVYTPIDKVAIQTIDKNTGSINLPVLSCTKYDGLVDSLEYFGKRVFSKDTSTYKIVLKGEFAYATNHIEEGSIGYQNRHEKALISPMYTSFKTNKQIDDDFLYKLLKSDLFIHIYRSSTSASVDRRGSLRWNEFSKIKIPLPTILEQKEIASVLSLAADEINKLKKQLDKLKVQKKGMMQLLLTGKKRVKTK